MIKKKYIKLVNRRENNNDIRNKWKFFDPTKKKYGLIYWSIKFNFYLLVSGNKPCGSVKKRPTVLSMNNAGISNNSNNTEDDNDNFEYIVFFSPVKTLSCKKQNKIK